MQARATFQRAPVPAAATRTLIVAVLAALTLGGVGGYALRGMSASAVPEARPVTTTPFVVEQPPYMTPRPSPIPDPTRDPKGFEVPI
jgi:hypothetical protein